MSDLQRYPLNLCLIKDFVDILIYIAREIKCKKTRECTLTRGEYSVHYNLESPGTRSSAIQIYKPYRCPDKGLKGTVVHRKCLFI